MSVCVGVSLEIVDGHIVTYNQEGGEMFCHGVRSIRHLAITATSKAGLFYVTKESGPGEVKRYKCYLFHLESASQVSYESCESYESMTTCVVNTLGGLPANTQMQL